MIKKRPLSGGQRAQKHVDKAKKSGGKRQPFTLTKEAVESLGLIREIEGDQSDTAVVNRVLVEHKTRLLRKPR